MDLKRTAMIVQVAIVSSGYSVTLTLTEKRTESPFVPKISCPIYLILYSYCTFACSMNS